MQNTTLCYLERDGQYLMLHRVKKAHDANKDKWIGVTDYRYRGLVTFVSDRWPAEYMHLFTADGWTGEMAACDEGELVWVDKARIPSLPVWAGDKLFFRLLEENVPFFSLKLVYKGETLTGAVLNGTPLPNLSSKEQAL